MAQTQNGWRQLFGSGPRKREGILALGGRAGRRQAHRVQVFNYIKTCRFTGVLRVDRRPPLRCLWKGGSDAS